ncbi:uncharacterized protein LOC121831447 [Peromyscus maniculatus bairdii]|uniref:uncharacterized protein LOC121831447 n=1 Tax=Peromyscus maniculatus bairdii TaxID=230844 RepID=UPI003FD57B42
MGCASRDGRRRDEEMLSPPLARTWRYVELTGSGKKLLASGGDKGRLLGTSQSCSPSWSEERCNTRKEQKRLESGGQGGCKSTQWPALGSEGKELNSRKGGSGSPELTAAQTAAGKPLPRVAGTEAGQCGRRAAREERPPVK